MDVVILAAGYGSRLPKPTPKGLIKIQEKTIVEHNIMNITKSIDIKKINLVTNKTYANDYNNVLKNSDINYNIILNEEVSRGNGYSLFLVRKEVHAPNFILIMSDHLFSIEFTSIACRGEGLAVDSCPIYIDERDATKVLLDADGKIKNIGKNLLNFDYFDTGFFVLDESIFLHATELVGIQRNISLSEIIKCSKIKTTNLTGKFWIDIDTSTDLSYARSWMTNQSLQS